jgi:hypothetical protein
MRCSPHTRLRLAEPVSCPDKQSKQRGVQNHLVFVLRIRTKTETAVRFLDSMGSHNQFKKNKRLVDAFILPSTLHPYTRTETIITKAHTLVSCFPSPQKRQKCPFASQECILLSCNSSNNKGCQHLLFTSHLDVDGNSTLGAECHSDQRRHLAARHTLAVKLQTVCAC